MSMAKPTQHLVMQRQIFCVYKLYKESISQEMNNDLKLHSMTKLLDWLCYWTLYAIVNTVYVPTVFL